MCMMSFVCLPLFLRWPKPNGSTCSAFVTFIGWLRNLAQAFTQRAAANVAAFEASKAAYTAKHEAFSKIGPFMRAFEDSILVRTAAVLERLVDFVRMHMHVRGNG
jgi:hypothetical protein